MAKEQSLKKGFEKWLEGEVTAAEKVGILVELAFVEEYLAKKRKGPLFNGTAESRERLMDSLSRSRSFHKYVIDAVTAYYKDTDTDEYAIYEIASMKEEQLDIACDYYSRYLFHLTMKRESHLIRYEEKPAAEKPKKKRERENLPKKNLFSQLKDFLKLTPLQAKELRALLAQIGEDSDAVWRNPEIRNLFKLRVFALVDEQGAVDLHEFMAEQKFPADPHWEKALQETLDELVKEGLLVYSALASMYSREIPLEKENNIWKFFLKYPNPREKMVFGLRLEGKSLKEIGDMLYVTRERVRQISVKVLQSKPTVAEDRWKDAWETYGAVGSVLFRYLFNMNTFSCNYLKIAYGAHKAAADDRKYWLGLLKDDAAIPEDIRKKAEGLLA